MVDNALLNTGCLGVILAGGQAARLGDEARGGDKCLIEIGGAPLLAHVLTRLRPQVAATVLSANGDPVRFKAYGVEVVADAEPGQGPLAGLDRRPRGGRTARPTLLPDGAGRRALAARRSRGTALRGDGEIGFAPWR